MGRGGSYQAEIFLVSASALLLEIRLHADE